MHADTEELFVERREQLHGYNPAMVPYLDANWWPYRGRFVNYSTNKIMAYGETRVEGSHGLLKRWLDHCSNNDIYKLAKKMLNWWESGHDQYQEFASRLEAYEHVERFLHRRGTRFEMVLENLQKARERLKPSHREDGTSLRAPPSSPTPITPRTAAATIASVTTTILHAIVAAAVLNERRGRPVSYGMYKSSSSNLFVTIGNVESREEGGSTDSPASTAVRAIEVPSIEAGNYTDDDFDLSSIEGDDASASLGSGMSSAYTNEYGRRYAVFGDVQYPFPMDEMEQSRGDMKHAILLMLTKNKLFLSPTGDNPQKILGIGTGTGEQRAWLAAFYCFATVAGLLTYLEKAPGQ
ncbi:hypothetical protein E4U38_003605 [Claviceps purpurea]|nr:hypothetical protein E4U38_003605 [Claviceps purpurea]